MLSVKRDGLAGLFCHEVRRPQLAELLQVVRIERVETGLDHVEILLLGHADFSPFEANDGAWELKRDVQLTGKT